MCSPRAIIGRMFPKLRHIFVDRSIVPKLAHAAVRLTTSQRDTVMRTLDLQTFRASGRSDGFLQAGLTPNTDRFAPRMSSIVSGWVDSMELIAKSFVRGVAQFRAFG